ncbi:hypothetical protein SBA2_450117 [Acidobacteriia bacterium SbA2]|nr:hypothetical protein SBA2_450117 [Acidobacteriia bacterium SbA2]
MFCVRVCRLSDSGERGCRVLTVILSEAKNLALIASSTDQSEIPRFARNDT